MRRGTGTSERAPRRRVRHKVYGGLFGVGEVLRHGPKIVTRRRVLVMWHYRGLLWCSETEIEPWRDDGVRRCDL